MKSLICLLTIIMLFSITTLPASASNTDSLNSSIATIINEILPDVSPTPSLSPTPTITETPSPTTTPSPAPTTAPVVTPVITNAPQQESSQNSGSSQQSSSNAPSSQTANTTSKVTVTPVPITPVSQSISFKYTPRIIPPIAQATDNPVVEQYKKIIEPSLTYFVHPTAANLYLIKSINQTQALQLEVTAFLLIITGSFLVYQVKRQEFISRILPLITLGLVTFNNYTKKKRDVVYHLHPIRHKKALL